MSQASSCDVCKVLFVPIRGTVSLSYSVLNGGSSRTGYSPTGEGEDFDLCSSCSEEFKKFIKHEDDDPVDPSPK